MHVPRMPNSPEGRRGKERPIRTQEGAHRWWSTKRSRLGAKQRAWLMTAIGERIWRKKKSDVTSEGVSMPLPRHSIVVLDSTRRRHSARGRTRLLSVSCGGPIAVEPLKQGDEQAPSRRRSSKEGGGGRGGGPLKRRSRCARAQPSPARNRFDATRRQSAGAPGSRVSQTSTGNRSTTTHPLVFPSTLLLLATLLPLQGPFLCPLPFLPPDLIRPRSDSETATGGGWRKNGP